MTEAERLRATLIKIREQAGSAIRPDAMPTLAKIARLASEALDPQPTTGRPELTDRQSEVLEVIRLYQERNGYSPTVRELMGILNIQGPNGVMCHLKPLQKKGYLRRNENIARSIVLVP